jgi:protein involved in polysaccharide export with SLBB domain
LLTVPQRRVVVACGSTLMHRLPSTFLRCAAGLLALCAVAALATAPMAARAQTSSGATGTAETPTSGPIRLRQATPTTDIDPRDSRDPRDPRAATTARERSAAPLRRAEPPLYLPSEFEQFVQRVAGDPTPPIRRFGAELVTPESDMPAEPSPLIPPDYVVKTGDEIVVTLWGSVDADVRQTVDRSGRITLPRVGPVLVAGVRYADLPATISQRVAQVFRNFQLSVSLGALRAQRVYITGFVAKPGTYSVNPLASVTQALLQAGGPSAAGSFRSIELRRGRERVAELDLYDFLLKGDRGADRLLQSEDVIHVGPLGTQVALIGSVNRPAVFELKAGEAVADLLRMAGGFSAVSDRSRLAVERLDERAGVRIVQLPMPASGSTMLNSGDVLRAFSAVDVALPVQRQNKRVRVEGEVLRPGEYVLPPASTVADALAEAGGLTAAAYPFGTEFSRESVRVTQQVNYDRALRDLEVDLARNASTQRAANAGEEAAQLASREAANTRLVASLRALRPNGRIVLQVAANARELPPLALEDGDRLYVPPRPTSVGVFGSVFNGGNYLYSDGREVNDYLNLAGGPTKGADASSTFVIRANGSVVSGQQQKAHWIGGGGSLAGLRAEPGDTVFVPEEINKTTFLQSAKDWTQILYQFGLGIAGIAAAAR